MQNTVILMKYHYVILRCGYFYLRKRLSDTIQGPLEIRKSDDHFCSFNYDKLCRLGFFYFKKTCLFFFILRVLACQHLLSALNTKYNRSICFKVFKNKIMHIYIIFKGSYKDNDINCKSRKCFRSGFGPFSCIVIYP